MPSDPAIDRADLEHLRMGDPEALNRLMARWQKPLLGFAYRYLQNSADAEDMAVEAFVRLYQRRDRLRPDSNVAAWLFTTLANLCRNHHRWRMRHPADAPTSVSPGADGSHDEPSSDPGPCTILERDESLDELREAVGGLPHDLRVTVLLHHYQQLSYAEIAAITHCSERGVETRLYRARLRLRERLGSLTRETSRA